MYIPITYLMRDQIQLQYTSQQLSLYHFKAPDGYPRMVMGMVQQSASRPSTDSRNTTITDTSRTIAKVWSDLVISMIQSKAMWFEVEANGTSPPPPPRAVFKHPHAPDALIKQNITCDPNLIHDTRPRNHALPLIRASLNEEEASASLRLRDIVRT